MTNSATLARVEAMARRTADVTGRAHVVLNLNQAGAPLYVCRELQDGMDTARIVSRFDPAPVAAPEAPARFRLIGHPETVFRVVARYMAAECIPSVRGVTLDGEHETCARVADVEFLEGPEAPAPVEAEAAEDVAAALAAGWRREADGTWSSAPPLAERGLGWRFRFVNSAREACAMDAAPMVPQTAQPQQARARGRAPQPARGERRYVTVRDTETGDVHRVLTSVARVGVAVVIFTPSNRHRAGDLGGMLITHDDIRKAWVFNDAAEARRMLSRNGAPGERVIRAELISDPAAA